MKRLFTIGVSVAAAAGLMLGCQDRDRSVIDEVPEDETARAADEDTYNLGQAAPEDTRTMARSRGEETRPAEGMGSQEPMGQESARPMGEEGAMAGSQMAARQEARGTVQAVDAQAGTLTLQTEAGETLTLHEQARAEADTGAATTPAATDQRSLENVEPGQMVSVTYESHEGKNWVQQIREAQSDTGAQPATEDPAAQEPGSTQGELPQE